MPSRTIAGLIWISGEDPKPCRIDLQENGVKVADSDFVGSANLFGLIDGRSYALGEYSFEHGSGQGHQYLDVAGVTSTGGTKRIEASALNRLCTLLQRDRDITLEIQTNRTSFSSRITPIRTATASDFFVCEINKENMFVDRDVIVVAHLLGMAYTFKAFVLDRGEDELALSLPKTAARFLRRFVPRVVGSWDVKIGSQKTPAKLVNLSPLGVCIQIESDGDKIDNWTEIQVSLSSHLSGEVDTFGLVVSKRDRFLHILLAGTNSGMKRRFYSLASETYKTFQFREDPEEAWNCLGRFKYLELMEGDVISSVKDDCVLAWLGLRESDNSFQPVAFSGAEAVGTIGAIQAGSDHWVPHALATKVDRSLIDVSSALYMAWPNFLLSLSYPLWMSTWYDANKPWHNRFYQVFIKENSDNPDVVTFVRQYYLATSLRDAHPNEIQIVDLGQEPVPNKQAETTWKNRWGRMARSPALKLERKTDFGFRHSFGEIRQECKSIGLYKIVTSENDVNPFCVLQSIHINLFEENSRGNEQIVRQVVSAALHYMKGLGLKRAALTLDYDVILKNPSSLGLAHFGEMRCLATSAPLLPALTSNNALSFADMKIRAKSS
jgi:hypothetical protein